MARARNIKPGFFQNEDLVELDYGTRLLFIGLWTLADREGRLENRPKKIKMQLFPADDLDIPRALLGLAKKNLVTLYAVDSIEYIQIDNFLKHQHPHHKEAESTIPAPVSTGQALGKTETDPSDSLIPITDSLNPKQEAKASDCREAIDYLNKKAGRSYKHVDSNLNLVKARLSEGHTLDDIKMVIDNRVAKWKGDAKMDEYLRPSTLFNATKFNDYAGEKTKVLQRPQRKELMA